MECFLARYCGAQVGQPVAVTAVFCFCVVHRMPYVQKLQQDCCRFELAWHAVNVG